MTSQIADVSLPPFVEFASISRLSRDMVVTEKIDGTNAQVTVLEDGRVLAGSRNRWITPEADNFGFAKWVAANSEVLRDGLGVGSHYGEWWGSGVQRGYGLTGGEKRFSLFNGSRWHAVDEDAKDYRCVECAICYVVPVLKRHTFNTVEIDGTLIQLAATGSNAAPGFVKPEGIVIWHAASRTLFKKTLDKNDGHKRA